MDNDFLNRTFEMIISQNQDTLVSESTHRIVNNALDYLGISEKDNFRPFIDLFMYNKAVMLLIDSENGKIVLANTSASIFYKYNLSEFQNLKISDINILSDEQIYEEMQNAKRFKRNHFKFIHKLKDNSIKNVEVFSTPFVSSDKTLLLSIIYDTSERMIVESELIRNNAELTKSINQISDQLVRQRALNNKLVDSERKLLEMNSRKDHFFSLISHDLRDTVLMFLKYSSTLKNTFINHFDSELQDTISSAYDASCNLNRLLENLLDWAMIQVGRVNIFIDDYNLRNIFELNITGFHHAAESKNIQIFNTIDNDIFVKTDLNMLNSIIRNLLSNAIKFNNYGGMVEISAHKDHSNFITIRITDSGMGIEPEIKMRLFDIKYRNHKTGTLGETGTGLGLILVKEMIDAYGGNIWFDSSPDVGTSFYFTVHKS